MDAPEADLTGWTASPFTAEGLTHDVYRKGEGPGVVLIPEIPGLTPQVLGLGNHLVDNGFSVASPSLFGEPGRALSVGYLVPTMARACIAREFMAFATNAERPVARYLRALARDLTERTPGKGVGVIGMCFTGGFALAAAVDDSVLAPVLSQPSLPFPLTPRSGVTRASPRRRWSGSWQRVTDDGLCAIGLRFTEDPAVPAERFETLRKRLGDAFEVIEIDSSPGNQYGFPRSAHSVLTDQVREQDGHPAYEARKRVVEFLNERLAAQ